MSRVSLSSGAGPSAKLQKGTHVKQEKAEGKGKQKARVEEEDEDADADADGDEEPLDEGVSYACGEDRDAEDEVDDVEDEGGSSRGAKRKRVNEKGDSRPGDGGKPKERFKTLPRDVDGYIPGSIVRIRLKNFVTYDFVEFSVGPYLNMILGPNGTGKSSIACAICLGLNFPPSVLGRAADLNSFVKNGTDEGYIEIELKGRKGEGNLVIRRLLSATSKGSSFRLNGNHASGKEIANKMGELNVQVGNLCSFLPQDKVSEFAQMSPQDLLKETQRAAGDERLSAWHETLIHDGKDLKTLLQSIKEESEQLRQMQERNEGIERDVQRYKERKSIEAMIALLEVLIPVERYREMRLKFIEVKKRQRKLHEKVKKLKAKNEPAHNLLKKLDADHKEHDKTREDIKKTTVAKFNKMKAKWTASEKLETDADELTSRLDRLKKEEKDRVKRIKGLEIDVDKTKEELAKLSEVKPEKHEDLVAEARQINLERADVVARKGDVDDKLRVNIDERAKSNVQLNVAQTDLKKLDDVDNRKLRSLQVWDRDCHDAVLWLRNNKGLFKMEVFEPPVLSLTVSDGRFVNAVEGCLSSFQLRTFVCQCQEDSDVFNYHINDNGALGRKVRVATWFRPQQQLPPQPLSREEMAMLGFDGYVLDYVECPEGMRFWLQRELNFHRTPVALNPNIDVNQAMNLVARPETGGGASFINGTTVNNVTRSRYGRRAVGNITRDLQPARNLANVTIDPEVKRRIDEKIASHQQELMNHDRERADLDAELNAILEEDKVFVKRLENVKARRDKLKKFQDVRVKVESKLLRFEDNLARLRRQPSADAERVRVKRDLFNITQKRIQIAKEYTGLARSVIAEQTEATRIGIRYLQIAANRAALQELCNKKDEKYQTALADFNKMDEEFRAIKIESKAALEESREVMNAADPELREQYNEIEAARTKYEKDVTAAEENGMTPPSAAGVDLRTLDELQAALETQRANLDLNLNTNPGVVEQYEKRKRDIEQLEKTIEEKQAKAEKLESKIKNARDQWQPALEKLVTSIGQKFSTSFDRIGCAGEIRISPHEDYEKWAIDILVKFRDTEKLQLLTGQRQSGGERSLTTILYLLSLTEEARAPFSLVDEINQGMDQRAERSVHNSMVQVTCKEDSAQYFLITPKLLPDLMYHDRMKILCVNNGEWLPEERDIGNMMSMIDGFVAARKKRPS
ncbi:hypothetical protein D9615_000804 [Tricholomella constricta]|uniref:Structural maintenance of chromosomes protein 5 n=1 Tax=Tricholomella constricta TaxID=117010 RepID=A0A8H5HSC6_9AGAR|nr:hypothetical protein D9615_000804 [Tricholomella constricta]